MATSKQRGPYAKGELKREEILDHAVEAFGKYGYHATSMREIAAACDLSQAGLLHYYPNKEALLMALVNRREESQAVIAAESTDEWFNQLIKRAAKNQKEATVTQLWASLAVEATDPEYPLHELFETRYENLRATWAGEFAKLSGHARPTDEDKIKAALLAAVWDGLQQQWLLDPTFDMNRPFEYALSMLSRYSQFKA